MTFILGKDNLCIRCKLEPLSGGEAINVERFQFTNISARMLADIMEKGVNKSNQNLSLDFIGCNKSDYEKLKNKRYKATFTAFIDKGYNILAIAEIILGNIEISFDMQNIEFDDIVTINFANITAYPDNNYSFREIGD